MTAVIWKAITSAISACFSQLGEAENDTAVRLFCAAQITNAGTAVRTYAVGKNAARYRAVADALLQLAAALRASDDI